MHLAAGLSILKFQFMVGAFVLPTFCIRSDPHCFQVQASQADWSSSSPRSLASALHAFAELRGTRERDLAQNLAQTFAARAAAANGIDLAMAVGACVV